MNLSCAAGFPHWLDYTRAFPEDIIVNVTQGNQPQKRENSTAGYWCVFSALALKFGFPFQSFIVESPGVSRPAIVLSVWLDGVVGRGESRSLKGWTLAAAKQGARRRHYHQCGPCVLLLWSNTVGPPSGWVPQPGRETGQEIIQKTQFYLFLTFVNCFFSSG